MSPRRLLRSMPLSIALLLLSLPTFAHEHLLPYFVSEAPIPVACHARTKNVFQAYKQFIRLSLHPSQWRTLLYIEERGLSKIAACLRLRPTHQKTLSFAQESGFKAVPRGSWVYPALQDLQRSGVVASVSPDDCFRSAQPRLLTRYEVAVVLSRVIGRCRVPVREEYGVEWETFGLDREKPCQAYRNLRSLCRQFQPELKAIGIASPEQEALIQTLDAYLSLHRKRTP